MDSYNKTNEIAFKLLTEMTDERNKSNQEYLAANKPIKEEIPQDADEEAKPTIQKENANKEESTTPKKIKMKVMKEMKGVLRMGETVDVVKKGGSYEVYKEIDGANPVKLNQKQAEEFFGKALSEAGVAETIGSGLRDILISGVNAAGVVVGGAIKGITREVIEKVSGKTLPQFERDATFKATTLAMQKLFQTAGIKVGEENIKQVLSNLLAKAQLKKMAKTSGTQPIKTTAEATSKAPVKSVVDKIEEDGFKPPKAKFVEKNALKPKKAKKIGAFRKGKVGEGTSSPKE